MNSEHGEATASAQEEERRRQITRLRAVYAVVAGAIMLFGLPLYQAVFLGPTGYAAAVTPAVEHGELAPLLAWIVRNGAADRGYRLLQLVPFLLAMPLPGFLYERLWSGAAREEWSGRMALWAGRAGFALFALAILVGLLTSAANAGAYASATSATARSAAVAGYARSFLIETLLSQGVGGLALAAFLALVSRRMERAPLYVRLFGYLVAALQLLNALTFLLNPGLVETPFTSGALFGLGLWLLGLGLLLPGIGRAAPPVAGQSSEPPHASGPE